MANIFEIPQINPLKLFQQSDILNTAAYTQSSYQAFNPNLNDLGIDSDFYYRQLKNYMDKDRYWQPYQQGDVIYLQWLGNDDYVLPLVNYVARLINCNGEVIKEVDCTAGSAVGSLYIRELEMPLYDVAEGKYFIQIHKVGYLTDYDFWVISEGIELKQKHLNTLLFRYSNSSNDQGIFYETGIEFQLRVHCAFTELNTGSKFNVYEDQPLNLTMLSGVPYREWTLFFGAGEHPIPDWMLDKIERLSLSDNWYIENVKYTRSEGAKLDATRIDKNPLCTAVLNVRPKSNDFDTYVSQYNQIVLGVNPGDIDFYVTILTQASPATSYPIALPFTSGQNFVDYLNAVDPLAIVDYNNTYFAINAQNKIVLLTNDGTVFSSFSPGLTFTSYDYCVKVGIIATATETDLVVDFSGVSSVKYAYWWGDGTKNTGTSTGTVVTKTYTDGDKYTARLFFSRVENLELSTSDQIIHVLGGSIPRECISFYLNANQLKTITNNIFTRVGGGLTDVQMTANVMLTATINNSIRWCFEAVGQFDNPATVDVSNQTPLAPPTPDNGLAYMIGFLSTNNVTLTTD